MFAIILPQEAQKTKRLIGFRNERDPMKVATMTKVPTGEMAEQTRSVIEIADSCPCESDMVS